MPRLVAPVVLCLMLFQLTTARGSALRSTAGLQGRQGTQIQARAASNSLERVMALCRDYTAGFIYPGADLPYGRRINGPRGIGALESPEAIAQRLVRGEYRPFGYGSGIEDLAYHNGMLLYALCDAEAATGEPLFKEMAHRAFTGLKRMSTLSKVEGFIPRGPHPDGKSYYPDSSLDQHSLYVCGLWRYYHSRLSSPEEKKWIQEMVAKVLWRLEKDGWSILKEDGSGASHAGGSMLAMEPTKVALLLVMLAAAHDVTGDAHWKQANDRFSAEADGQRWKQLAKKIDRDKKPDWPRWNLFYNQDVLRTETLRRIERDPARKAVLRARITNMAEDMLTAPYFRTWRSLDWIGDEEASAAEADESANAYLKPLGLTVESGIGVMDLWKAYDQNHAKEAMLGRRLTRYEPLLLATPAMVWQCALLSAKPELIAQVRPAIEEMLVRVDFGKVDLGWAYNYAVLASLWNLAIAREAHE